MNTEKHALIQVFGLLATISLSTQASAQDRAGRATGAGEKDHCVNEAERAQHLKFTGRLRETREALHVCVQDKCPAVVRTDCARWLAEVGNAMASVVVQARDAAGVPVQHVSVSIDGTKVADRIDDQPIDLDPGEHSFEYTSPGLSRIAEKVLLGTGEKSHVLSVHFPPPQRVAPPLPSPLVRELGPAPTLAIAPVSGGSPPLNVAAWAALGVSAATLGSFAYFGITGKSDLDHLREGCGGSCDRSEIDAAWSKLIVADVSLGAAILAGGIATWLFFTPPHNDEREGGAAKVTLAPMRRGVSVTWEATF
jgi:hypothetical protein